MDQNESEFHPDSKVQSKRLATALSGNMDTEDGMRSDEEVEAEEEVEEVDSEGELDRLGDSLDAMYEHYQNRMSDRKQHLRENMKKYEEWHGFDEEATGHDVDTDDSDDGGGYPNKDIVEDSDSDSDSDIDSNEKPADQLSSSASMFFNNPIFNSLNTKLADTNTNSKKRKLEKTKSAKANDDEDQFSDIEEAESEEDDIESKKQAIDIGGQKRFEEEQKELDLTTPEALTLAMQIVNKQKTAAEVIDDGFNRYSFNDSEELPAWFLDDEKHHYRPILPVTKEAVREFRDRMKALDARPIKKIAEAKARKKLKAAQRLAKLTKKASQIADSEDMTEKEKASSIERLMSKKAKPTKKSKVKLVVAKGGNRGVKGRPSGVKGRYKMVDPRMRKEIRAEKRQAAKSTNKRL
jgi:AdoMet-dependent rRNA methyltransferase SPB1